MRYFKLVNFEDDFIRNHGLVGVIVCSGSKRLPKVLAANTAYEFKHHKKDNAYKFRNITTTFYGREVKEIYLIDNDYEIF